jgi:hypothetical protein
MAMPSAPRRVGSGKWLLLTAAFIGLILAACSSTATPAAPSQTVAAATATATSSASATAEPSATATAAATATPAATDTATPSPTAAPTAMPTAVPTALPPLAVGLCKASQLKLTITLWEGSTGTSYAHVTATNRSSVNCNMRGTSEARIADAHGLIIGDAGAAAAKVVASDPVYTLIPGGKINTIITWGNWCHAAPAQKVFVAMVLPFGLGGIVSNPLGNAPIPTCYSSSQKTQVSSEAWLP